MWGSSASSTKTAVLGLPDRAIWAVADGMGGHEAGEVASAKVVEAFVASCRGAPSGRAGAPCDRRAQAGEPGADRPRQSTGWSRRPSAAPWSACRSATGNIAASGRATAAPTASGRRDRAGHARSQPGAGSDRGQDAGPGRRRNASQRQRHHPRGRRGGGFAGRYGGRRRLQRRYFRARQRRADPAWSARSRSSRRSIRSRSTKRPTTCSRWCLSAARRTMSRS